MTLDQFRRDRNLRLTDLASLLGAKPSTVHGWLNGHRRPSWEWVERIHEVTGGAVSADDFMTCPSSHAAASEPAAPEAA